MIAADGEHGPEGASERGAESTTPLDLLAAATAPQGSCNTPDASKFRRETSSVRIAGAGYHDVCVRWDVSDPQPVVGRLMRLPGIGDMTKTGKKLFAERDGFGRWEHLLGPRHSMLVYTHAPPSKDNHVIRRLEVQAHLGPEGEDDLCAVDDFPRRWLALQERMALCGVLPVTDARLVRVDPAVDVEYDDPGEGFNVLEALRFARWPRGWYAEWQGPPPYTTVAIKSGRRTVARAYCRNTKVRNEGARWGKLRFEAEQRFEWRTALDVEHLGNPLAPAIFWGAVFGEGRAAGKVTRIAKEVQTVKLIERVQLSEITYSQYERMTAFLDAERLGMLDRVYTPAQIRARRREAAQLGVSAQDAITDELDVSLDEALAVPRSAFVAA